jgi:hypothetical protein
VDGFLDLDNPHDCLDPCLPATVLDKLRPFLWVMVDTAALASDRLGRGQTGQVIQSRLGVSAS